jgi:hypothetical protein
MRQWFTAFLAFSSLALATACFRVDSSPMHVSVKGMDSRRDIVLVTNAAQRELMGEMPEINHLCAIDIPSSMLYYYEGPRVRDVQYQMRILSALDEIGYRGKIVGVKHLPSPPMMVMNYAQPVVLWPDRHVIIIQIPAMKNNMDANRVTDAMAYARLGGRPINLLVDDRNQSVMIAHHNKRLSSFGNYAHSIASAGYGITGWSERYEESEAPARGWIPVDG